MYNVWPTMERTLRVLLVEDAPFLRYAFGRLLRMQGYEVREANDGREALDCLRGSQGGKSSKLTGSQPKTATVSEVWKTFLLEKPSVTSAPTSS